MSFSFEVPFEATSSHGNSTTNKYEFSLGPRSSCTSSMMHIELLYGISTVTYWYDTFLKSMSTTLAGGRPNFEYNMNRHEKDQPYGKEPVDTGVQYCRDDTLRRLNSTHKIKLMICGN